MYPGGQAIGQYNETEKCLVDNRIDRTVGENIDAKIVMLKKEIERLEASKVTLAPLLSMQIRDIREAMNY